MTHSEGLEVHTVEELWLDDSKLIVTQIQLFQSVKLPKGKRDVLELVVAQIYEL